MAREIKHKKVVAYVDEYGNEPYTEWLSGLKDKKNRERIRIRIRRLESGLYGDCATVGEGVSEWRMFFGPDYRFFFGEDEEDIVILLCGGDKSSQSREIKIAKTYWKEYKEDG